jgi:hypothetical protein
LRCVFFHGRWHHHLPFGAFWCERPGCGQYDVDPWGGK